jgi:anti-sigma-K factor RskA
MKYQSPKLQRMLSAEYVLGTLHSRARARFQRLLTHDAALRREVNYWEIRLAGLNGHFKPETPRGIVWASIHYQINAGSKKVVPLRPENAAPARSALWRNWAVVSTAACALLGFSLIQQMNRPPQIVTKTETVRVEVPVVQPMPYVAMMQIPKSEAKWKVSIYPDKGVIKVATSGRYAIDEQAKSLELWVVSKDGPHSLGLLPTQGDGEMKMPEGLQLDAGDATLAISLEPHGGSPTGKPTGPVLLAAPAVRPA